LQVSAFVYARMDLHINDLHMEIKIHIIHCHCLCLEQCREGKLEDVKRLVEAGLDPSKVFDVNRRTPLQLAEE